MWGLWNGLGFEGRVGWVWVLGMIREVWIGKGGREGVGVTMLFRGMFIQIHHSQSTLQESLFLGGWRLPHAILLPLIFLFLSHSNPTIAFAAASCPQSPYKHSVACSTPLVADPEGDSWRLPVYSLIRFMRETTAHHFLKMA